MGYHSLIEISHDRFHEVERKPEAFVRDLGAYVRSGCSEQAANLDRHDVKVIGIRHAGERYIVSAKVDGFPIRAPFAEEVEAEQAAWAATTRKAKAFLAGTVKLRTISDLRRLVAALVERTIDADATIAIADPAIGSGERLLSDPQWRPTREDYESALADIKSIRAQNEPRRTTN